MNVKLAVAHFNFSATGGPGLVATTLNRELMEMGVSSELFSNGNFSLRNQPLSFPLLSLSAVADDLLIRNPSWPSPVTLLRNNRTSLVEWPALSRHHVVHLHWTHGFLSLDEIEEISNPVVWTLHDMRPLTGGCHQKLGCERYEYDCTSCPAVRPMFRRMVERQRLQINKFARAKSDLLFIAPTSWMKKELVAGYPHLEDRIRVIHHAVSVKTPSEKLVSIDFPKSQSQSQKKIAVIGGLYDSALKGLTNIQPLLVELSKKSRVTVVGQVKSRLPGVHYLQPMTRLKFLDFLDSQDAILIPSLGESFSLVAFEAASLGKIVFGEQGSAIEEVASSYGTFIPISSAADFSGVNWEVGAARIRRSAKEMAQEYLAIYEELLRI